MHRHRFTRRCFGSCLALASLLVAFAATGSALAQSEGQPQPETQTFQDWTLACIQREDGARACRMVQNVGNEQGQVVMQTAIMMLPDGSPGLLFNLPLGVWLADGITIQIDGGEEITVPYARCLQPPEQCRVELILDQTRVDQLRAGTQISVTFYDPQQRPIRATVSLLGFTAAFNGLTG